MYIHYIQRYTYTHIYVKYVYIKMMTNIYICTGSLAQWVECSPMIWETWVQSLVASYRRLLKWYFLPPCLTLNNIRYVSRVKWSNPGKAEAPSPIEKGAFWLPSTTVINFTLFTYIHKYREVKMKYIKVRSPNGDTDYFNIVAGVLQGDALAQYLFIICR